MYCISGLVNELLGHIDKAMEYAVKSEYESAVEELEYAIEKWSRVTATPIYL